MPTRALTVPEGVVVRHSLAAARALCDKIAKASDQQLGGAVAKLMNLRPTPDRLKGIRDDFQKVSKALEQTSVDNVTRVEGQPNLFAYVDPNKPYHITVGDAFFTASRNKGTDTTAGTLIHEATHWTSVIGTQDHAYGDVQNLSATLARNNADTLERIAETL